MYQALPIMTKAKTIRSTRRDSTEPYPLTRNESQAPTVWTGEQDEQLLAARASGLNWQPISNRFPGKSANACRKRHERLIERRNVEDWDSERLDQLALKYQAMRRQMWEILAAELGERWSVVEMKCMEKGLKNLQSIARTAQRKEAVNARGSYEEQGAADHTSDSGIGLGSDTEMDTAPGGGALHGGYESSSARTMQWPPRSTSYAYQSQIHPQLRSHHIHAGPPQQHQQPHHGLPHPRTGMMVAPLPLYQPPPPVRRASEGQAAPGPAGPSSMRPVTYSGYSNVGTRWSPESQGSRSGGISIESVLAPSGQHQRA